MTILDKLEEKDATYSEIKRQFIGFRSASDTVSMTEENSIATHRTNPHSRTKLSRLVRSCMSSEEMEDFIRMSEEDSRIYRNRDSDRLHIGTLVL